MTRFRPINHCLVVYRYDAQPDGDLVFLVYDVNQPGKLVHLRYQRSDESFYFDKSWYYPGGLVNILPIVCVAIDLARKSLAPALWNKGVPVCILLLRRRANKSERVVYLSPAQLGTGAEVARYQPPRKKINT
jgi:hypothetical protein